jgi:MYXO-CTERM domain-containing protein
MSRSNREENRGFIMNKRFMLTAAGAATTAFAASASAELLTFNYDYYANESGWSIADSDGNVVISAAAAVVSTSLSYSSGLWYGNSASSPYPYGYLHLVSVALAAGDYTITLTDTWGDGWEYFSPTGSGLSAFVGGGLTLAFTSGSSVTGSFTVGAIPAPGALALLGLAGLASRKRRAE